MGVIGSAEILVEPNMAGFAPAVKAETSAALGGVTKDAEKAGEEAGKGLSRGAGTGLKDLGGAIGSAGIPLGSFGERLDKTGGKVDQLASHSGGLAKTLGSVPTPLAAAGVAALAAGVATVKLAEGMEEADTAISSAAGTSVAAAKKIGDAFLNTAGKSVFSGEEMAKAFASVAGQLASVQGHALKTGEASEFMDAAGALAESRQISLGEATSSLANVMQTFKLKTDEASHAADDLYTTSRDTGVGVETLASTFSKMRSKLGEASGTVGQMSGLILDMKNQGISGRPAISALNSTIGELEKKAGGVSKALGEQKQAFNALDGPTKALVKGYENGSVSSAELTKKTKGLAPAQAELVAAYTKASTAVRSSQQVYKDMGVTVFNSKGEFVGMGSIIDQLGPKFSKMTAEQKRSTAETLFGKSAASAMTAVLDAGSKAYNSATKAVEKKGTAEKAAQQQSKTLGGEVKTLSATFSDLGTKLGQVLIPVVTKFGGVLVTLVGVVGTVVGFIKAHWELILPILLGPFAPVLLAFGHFRTATEGVFSGIVKWIEGAWHSVANLTSSLVSSIVGFFSGLPGKIAGIFDSVAHDASGLIGEVVGFFSHLPGKVLNVLEGLPGEMLSLGEKVIEGLIEGMEHQASALLSKAKSIVEAPKHLLEKVFSFGSPSKVTTKMGEQIVEGLSGGMSAKEASAGGSAKSVAETILHFFEGKGLSHAQAAGIVGNTMQESSNNAKEAGGGLDQGQGARDHSSLSLMGQLNAIWKELTGEYKSVLGELKAARSPAEAAHIFSGSAASGRGFERPGEPAFSKREQYAREAAGLRGTHKAPVETVTNVGAWAEKMIGHYAESTGKNTGTELDKLQGEFHTRAAAWCAEFATTAAAMGGANKAVKTASVATIREWAEQGSHGYSKGISHDPKKGALMLFGNEHVGYVDSVNKKKGTVTTIEGNTNVGDGAVRRVTHKIGEGDYANPKYPAGSPSAAGGTPAEKQALARMIAQQKQNLAEWVAKMDAEAKKGTAAQKAGIAKEVADRKASVAKEIADEKTSGKARQDAEKAELKKQTSDKKTGESTFGKLQTAVQEGSLKSLNTLLNKTHEAALSKIEKSLDGDHKSALTKLSGELVKVHKEALAKRAQLEAEAAAEAATKAREADEAAKAKEAEERTANEAAALDAQIAGISKETALAKDAAEYQATSISDSTAITLDRQAEAGLSGLELTAAKAQTSADEVTMRNDLAIKAAETRADEAAGTGPLAEAQAAAAVQAAENKASVEEAEARAKAELARAAAGASGATPTPAAGVPSGDWHFNFYGANPTAADIMAEVGWTLKTGALPVAAPAGAPA